MEAPKLPTIFKQNRARSFDFKPRYYDERKERIEKIKQKYNKTGQNDTSTKSSIDFRSEMSSEWRNSRKGSVKNSNGRLLGIIVVLALITYLIIYY